MTMSLTTLGQVLAEARVKGENPSGMAGHIDPSRHMAVSPTLFFKKLRPGGPGFEYHDLACELFCSRLAGRLSLPVPACLPIATSGLGVGLLSAFVGQKTIAGVPLESIANADKLAMMSVFEQLVMNQDDKTDHFRVRDLPTGKCEFFVVDHGHTLHAWKVELQDPATIDAAPRQSTAALRERFWASRSRVSWACIGRSVPRTGGDTGRRSRSSKIRRRRASAQDNHDQGHSDESEEFGSDYPAEVPAVQRQNRLGTDNRPYGWSGRMMLLKGRLERLEGLLA